MAKGFFITGTDTGVGKTHVAVEIMRSLRQSRKTVVGFKPVASGGEQIDGVLQNEDARALMREASIENDYELINPYCFEPAIAPHIAAQQADVKIKLSKLQRCYQQLERQAEFVIVEGAGGWATPIDQQEGLNDLAVSLSLPVILVVGLRLGCINHALLTEAAVLQSGCEIAAWVANPLTSNFAEQEQNIQTLTERIKAPCLGVCEFVQNCQDKTRSRQINTQVLLDY
jgi:dethiobiotin synthetase